MMPQFQFALTTIITISLLQTTMIFVDARLFEYELPNRTVTICPSYSLISIECPQIPSLSIERSWQPNLPTYLISIDYIRSFPLRLGFDASSCQPDLSHACSNYDLRYVNTLCNGRPRCIDISAYQIRERSLCAFKAVTEIGFHCVPTWNLAELQTKFDICHNATLTNEYGFIHSRYYPSKTVRTLCTTTIFAKPNHRIMLYFVNGELNHDQLRIESVASNGLTILNASLNGNLTTQRLAASVHEMKITFSPSPIYSYYPTYFLLYFYSTPICSINEPCLSETLLMTTSTTWSITTSRTRVKSVGWTHVSNIWIVIPIILAYILLLLLIVALALLFRRRRKRGKVLGNATDTNLSSHYLDASGTSSRVQLVPTLPPSHGNSIVYDAYPPVHRPNTSLSARRSLSTSSFGKNMDRYYRESRSDYNLNRSGLHGFDYRYPASIPYRDLSMASNGQYRGYGTMDYSLFGYDANRYRRPLPKSFSDCNLCKRNIANEEYEQYLNERDDNWRLENTFERRGEPRTSRDKIKDRFRERVPVHSKPDNDTAAPPPTTTVEYSTVLPRHQRIASEINRSNGSVHHLPFEYAPNETPTSIRTNEFKRNLSNEHLATGNNQPFTTNNEHDATNYNNAKPYVRNIDETRTHSDKCAHDDREIQEMSMRMNDQQNFNRYQHYQPQQRRFNGNKNDI